jgi:hypothetical protein
MTDFPKKPAKKRNRLGDLPADESTTLEQPEHAPAELSERKARKKTGRTEPFGTRVSPEFLMEFKRLAFEDGLKNVELLEAMMATYKGQR